MSIKPSDLLAVTRPTGADKGIYKVNASALKSYAHMTAAEIKAAYEGNANTNVFTDADKSKLGTIAPNAEVNVQPDWDATSGDGEILHKPTIPTYGNAVKPGTQGDIATTPGLYHSGYINSLDSI